MIIVFSYFLVCGRIHIMSCITYCANIVNIHSNVFRHTDVSTYRKICTNNGVWKSLTLSISSCIIEWEEHVHTQTKVTIQLLYMYVHKDNYTIKEKTWKLRCMYNIFIRHPWRSQLVICWLLLFRMIYYVITNGGFAGSGFHK